MGVARLYPISLWTDNVTYCSSSCNEECKWTVTTHHSTICNWTSDKWPCFPSSLQPGSSKRVPMTAQLHGSNWMGSCHQWALVQAQCLTDHWQTNSQRSFHAWWWQTWLGRPRLVLLLLATCYCRLPDPSRAFSPNSPDPSHPSSTTVVCMYVYTVQRSGGQQSTVYSKTRCWLCSPSHLQKHCHGKGSLQTKSQSSSLLWPDRLARWGVLTGGILKRQLIAPSPTNQDVKDNKVMIKGWAGTVWKFQQTLEDAEGATNPLRWTYWTCHKPQPRNRWHWLLPKILKMWWPCPRLPHSQPLHTSQDSSVRSGLHTIHCPIAIANSDWMNHPVKLELLAQWSMNQVINIQLVNRPSLSLEAMTNVQVQLSPSPFHVQVTDPVCGDLEVSATGLHFQRRTCPKMSAKNPQSFPAPNKSSPLTSSEALWDSQTICQIVVEPPVCFCQCKHVGISRGTSGSSTKLPGILAWAAARSNKMRHATCFQVSCQRHAWDHQCGKRWGIASGWKPSWNLQTVHLHLPNGH